VSNSLKLVEYSFTGGRFGVLVGLISDTHDNISAIQSAVKLLNERGAGLVLHAGDHNSPFTLRFFKALKARLIGVYGNVDGERGGLYMRYRELGWELKGEIAEVEVEGVRVALIHGTDPPLISALAKCGDYNVVVHGHTHMARKDMVSGVLVVNPGEACGYLTGKRSIALLDTAERSVEFVEL